MCLVDRKEIGSGPSGSELSPLVTSDLCWQDICRAVTPVRISPISTKVRRKIEKKVVLAVKQSICPFSVLISDGECDVQNRLAIDLVRNQCGASG